ncbi:MAG TPA: allantoinase AllB [Gemmatimonadales bacterium]|nr:allantoinase AllB [Gemmatimonadales bacterium]
MSADLVVSSKRVVTPDGERAAAVVVTHGRIQAVVAPGEAPPAKTAIDAGAAAVLPGVVDTHVHINEPGRTEWEGFATATRAAAAGGVTTVVDMPLNSIPATTTTAALRLKLRAAAPAALVDYGFWGGVVPGNVRDLEPLLDAGALGFKCFLVPSGVDEFAQVGEADLRPAMQLLAARDAVLLAHAELPGPIARAVSGADPRRYATWLASRPEAAELEAIELLLRLSRETGCRVHIVHLSAATGLGGLETARRDGVRVSVETCPHYLTFAAEDVPDGATAFKCAPPLRERANRERLWDGLARGIIDLVASDHSPAPPALKRLDSGDFMAAWGGVASLELSLAACWTGAHARGHGLSDLARWLCAGPARLAGLDQKGRIAPGCDADFVIFDPDAVWTVDPARLRQRHPITPYTGMALRGVVQRTFVRGLSVYANGRSMERPEGQWLRRTASD